MGFVLDKVLFPLSYNLDMNTCESLIMSGLENTFDIQFSLSYPVVLL